MFSIKNILKGAGVNHIITGIEIDTDDDITIFQNGTNLSTKWNDIIINNMRYNESWEN